MSRSVRVGWIGTGAMGRPMASRLIAAGHDVGVWARRRESAADLCAAGAVWCATPQALAARSEVVISIITGGDDVESVALGAEGLVAGFATGSVFIDMSTIAPTVARRIAAALSARGVAMLDAPVSGGVVGAKAGSLSIMAGGEPDALQRVRPLFECLGQTIVHVGPSGSGQVAKACNQLVMVAAIQAVAEAMRLTVAAGVDPAAVHAALVGGSAASRVLDVFGRRMVDGDFSAGVEARLHHKDYAILLGEAHHMNLSLPLTASVSQQLNALMARGWGREDTSRLLSVLAEG